MFDPTILLSLEPTMAPNPLRMVQERIWETSDGKRTNEIARQTVASYEKIALDWHNLLEEKKSGIQRESLKLDGGDCLRSDKEERKHFVALMDHVILELEQFAEVRAKNTERLVKRNARDVKEKMRGDPSVGAAYRELGQGLVAADKRIVTDLLEFALFLRTFRAEAADDARGGRTFEKPDELDAYLDGLVAA